ERRVVHDALEHRELLLAEPEPLDRLEQPAGARHHAVAAALREPAGEHLEHAPPAGRAVGERGSRHGQFVPVGEQRGGHTGRRRTASHGSRAYVPCAPNGGGVTMDVWPRRYPYPLAMWSRTSPRTRRPTSRGRRSSGTTRST